MAACRECDTLLRHAPEQCPCCGARRPVLETASVSVTPLLSAAVALGAIPFLLAVDRVALWLLTPPAG